MSDVENVDVMFGNYSRNDEKNYQSEIELNLDSESSRPQRNSNVTGEDFRSLLKNSRENSEITIETTRMINEEISNQMSRRLNEIKASLNFSYKTQIQQQSLIQYFLLFKIRWKCRGINFTNLDRGSVGPHPGPRTENSTMEDQRSCGLQRNPEAENAQKRWENRPERCFTQENSRQMSRDSSVDSYNSLQNGDSFSCLRSVMRRFYITYLP